MKAKIEIWGVCPTQLWWEITLQNNIKICGNTNQYHYSYCDTGIYKCGYCGGWTNSSTFKEDICLLWKDLAISLACVSTPPSIYLQAMKSYKREKAIEKEYECPIPTDDMKEILKIIKEELYQYKRRGFFETEDYKELMNAINTIEQNL